MKPLIVAAAQFEASPVLKSLEKIGVSADLFILGVGALEAARQSTKLDTKGRDVIYVGSCGLFDNFNGLELVGVEKAVWLPTCERHGLSYSIKNTNPPVAFSQYPKWSENIERKIVICSPTISISPKLPELFIPKNTVENVELYSAANKLIEAKSLSLLLAVTNQIGPTAHTQWKQNFKNASQVVADFIERNFHEN